MQVGFLWKQHSVLSGTSRVLSRLKARLRRLQQSGSRLQTYALNNGHSKAQDMEFWFWTVAASGWLAISVDSARRQTPLLLLDQAHAR